MKKAKAKPIKNKDTSEPISETQNKAIHEDVMAAAQREISICAEEINAVLNKHGMGMQAVIQIFKNQKSPIIAQGHTGKPNEIIIPGQNNQDLPQDILDLLKPDGDKIGRD